MRSLELIEWVVLCGLVACAALTIALLVIIALDALTRNPNA